MEKEYLIMDDGGNVSPDQITPEMLTVYETVVEQLKGKEKMSCSDGQLVVDLAAFSGMLMKIK